MEYLIFLMWLFAVPAIPAGAYLTLLSMRRSRVRAIETEFPNFISSMVEGMRNGEGLETALMAAATTSEGPIRGSVNRLHDRLLEGMTFSEALDEFGRESGSMMIERTVGMLQIAIEHGAEMAETLERVGQDMWAIYMLQVERQAAAKKEANLLLVGGILLTPAILGLTFGMFESTGMGAVLMPIIVVYMIWYGFISAMFYGAISGRMTDAALMSPTFIFLSLLLLLVGKMLYVG